MSPFIAIKAPNKVNPLFANRLLTSRCVMLTLMVMICSVITVSTYAQRVGINVPNPNSTLHVNSIDNSSPIRIQNQGQTKFRIFSNNAIAFGSNWDTPLADVVRFNNPHVFMGFNASHMPQHRLEVDGSVLLSGMTMTTGASDGYVLKSDAAGNASWQAESGGSSSSGLDLLQSTNRSFSSSTPTVGNVGRSVSILGDRALVGASFSSGRRFWIQKNNTYWEIDNGVTQSGSSQYGYASAFNSTHLLVGGPAKNNQTGSAYFYAYSSCCLTPFGEFTGSDSDANDFFGRVLAFDGDYIAVGAPFKSAGTLGGKVYIFKIDYANQTVTEEDAINGIAGTRFGVSIDIQGDDLVVGAPSTSAGVAGKVYVFARSGTSWLLQQTIDGPPSTPFGNAVSMSGNKLAVGGIGGLVHVYSKVGTSYILEEDITPVSTSRFDEYGTSLKLVGDDLVIGAPGYDVNAKVNAGAAFYYAYENGSWTFKNFYVAPDPGDGDRLGDSIDTDGTNVIIGAPLAEGSGTTGKGKVVILPLQ